MITDYVHILYDVALYYMMVYYINILYIFDIQKVWCLPLDPWTIIFAANFIEGDDKLALEQYTIEAHGSHAEIIEAENTCALAPKKDFSILLSSFVAEV